MSWFGWAIAAQDRLDAGEELSRIEMSLLETCQRTMAKTLNDAFLKEMRPMKFREHRGLLADSMETLFEFTTRDELMAHIAKIHGDWDHGYDPATIKISLYVDGPDERIGWDKTYIVAVKGYGVIGFTDGPVP